MWLIILLSVVAYFFVGGVCAFLGSAAGAFEAEGEIFLPIVFYAWPLLPLFFIFSILQMKTARNCILYIAALPIMLIMLIMKLFS